MEIGDVVVLKSGGPTMTVTEVDGGVRCNWFRQVGGDWIESVFDTFPKDALKVV